MLPSLNVLIAETLAKDITSRDFSTGCQKMLAVGDARQRAGPCFLCFPPSLPSLVQVAIQRLRLLLPRAF